jgi:hypothetical protein
MPQDQSPLSWSGDGRAVVKYRPTAQIHGSLLDAQGLPIGGARVVARLDAALPGQNAYSTGTLTTDTSGVMFPTGSFSLNVPLSQQPTSQPYHLWVGFDSAARASLSPPLIRDLTVTGNLELPLRLRSVADLAVVTGRIVTPLGEGVGNQTVQVLDADNQVVSSTAISDASGGATSGSYRVLVDPSLSSNPQSPLTVVVRPAPLDPTQIILQATLQPPRPGSETRVDFAVPSHRTPVVYQLPIRGGASGSSSSPVAGARVSAQVSLEDAATLKLGTRAYYIATGESDSQGQAKLSLVPAPTGGPNLVYQVTINSPSHLPFASVPQAQVQVGPNGPTDGLLAAVTLPLRAQVHGRLRSPLGAPVSGAQVVASRTSSTETEASPVASMLVTADLPQSITDVDGSFALRLDPGDYDLEFIPLPGTNARSSLDNQRIATSDIELGDVRLPPNTLGVLEVLSPLGAPVAETKVRLFQLPDTTKHAGVSCDVGLPCSRNAKLRAEAFTDQYGHARLLLPGGSPRRE